MPGQYNFGEVEHPEIIPASYNASIEEQYGLSGSTSSNMPVQGSMGHEPGSHDPLALQRNVATACLFILE